MNKRLIDWIWRQECQAEDKLTMLAFAKLSYDGWIYSTNLTGVQKLTAWTEEEVKASIGRLDYLGLVTFEGSIVALAPEMVIA